jgi:hypothetical protein
VLIAFWAVFQSFRKEASVYSLMERKFIWFWSSVALICVLVGFGRFAPFYQIFYALPFASTMRNPSKFFHVVAWILVILFAYGMHGLSRSCLETPRAVLRGLSSQLQSWWAKAAAFEKNWLRGSLIALGFGVLGWIIYARSRDSLIAYLKEVDFDEGLAGPMATFSIQQVGWFVLFLALGVGAVALIMSGYFNGRRARAGAILLGVLVAADLGRANLPWVVTWDWERKYATNEVLDRLREKPYEQRVAMLPFGSGSTFGSLYNIEWLQQLFQYYNIQSLDVIMNPRPKEDQVAFETALFFNGTSNTLHRIARRWQLTNTRYLLGPVQMAQGVPTVEVLNRELEPARRSFRVAATFDVTPKPGFPEPTGLDQLSAAFTPNGHYAIFDFTGALPRAKLYAQWQVMTNDQAALATLENPAFDPAQTILLSTPLSVPSGTNQDAGTAEFTSYAPKHVVLQAKPTTPAVLLLNDRYESNWQVTVDGKPAPLLRCNFLMRGVFLTPGTHTVDFRFAPPVDTIYVSIAAVGIGLLMLGYLAFGKRE